LALRAKKWKTSYAMSSLAMLEGERLLGWIGGLPEYNGRVWELHPLVVPPESRRQGIGRALVAAFESESSSGALTASLGTDVRP
jgi:aminoglycoside 6'-N-acetyltransferase I